MSDTWYITINGKKVGPLTLQHLKATLATFANAKDVLVWGDSLADWKPAKDVPELRQTTPPPLSPAAPSAQRKAMQSSAGLDDIRPTGRIGAIEGTTKQRIGPQLTVANVASAIAILAMVAFAFAMSKSGERAGSATNLRNAELNNEHQSSPAVSALAEYRQEAAPPEKSESIDDIVQNKAFLTQNPKYLDAILFLITDSGFECPRLAHLWLNGISPLGIKLEALCGPRGSSDVYMVLHYAVYPDRLKVVVCKPFGIFGGAGCE